MFDAVYYMYITVTHVYAPMYIGGSGDWLDVQNCTVMMDNYTCLDVTKKARSISHTFCHGESCLSLV